MRKTVQNKRIFKNNDFAKALATPCGERAPEGPRKKNDFLKKWVLTNQSRRDRIHTQKQAGVVSPGHKGAPARIVSVSVRGLECWIMYGLLCMIFSFLGGEFQLAPRKKKLC